MLPAAPHRLIETEKPHKMCFPMKHVLCGLPQPESALFIFPFPVPARRRIIWERSEYQLVSVPVLYRSNIIHFLENPVKVFYILIPHRLRNALNSGSAAL